MKDKTVSKSYREKFQAHVTELKKFRARMEKPSSTSPVTKKEVRSAQDAINIIKDDLSAWNRIRPIYAK